MFLFVKQAFFERKEGTRREWNKFSEERIPAPSPAVLPEEGEAGGWGNGGGGCRCIFLHTWWADAPRYEALCWELSLIYCHPEKRVLLCKQHVYNRAQVYDSFWKSTYPSLEPQILPVKPKLVLFFVLFLCDFCFCFLFFVLFCFFLSFFLCMKDRYWKIGFRKANIFAMNREILPRKLNLTPGVCAQW